MTEVSVKVPQPARPAEPEPMLNPTVPSKAEAQRCTVEMLPKEPDHRPEPQRRSAGGNQRSGGRLPANDYKQLVESIRVVVNALVPPGAVVTVLSKGDAQLVQFKKRVGWHFPQGPDGNYAGYHPADSNGAIEELEKSRARGAN